MACASLVHAEDLAIAVKIKETNPKRLAPNDTKEGIYKAEAQFKSRALLVQGKDYNYYFLTIVPYDSIQALRREERPLVEDVGEALAMGGVSGALIAKSTKVTWVSFDYGGRDGKSHTLEFPLSTESADQFGAALSDRTGLVVERYKDGKKVAQIGKGMGTAEVIAIKGSPKDRLHIEDKTILIYEDVKLVFERGKLVDIQ